MIIIQITTEKFLYLIRTGYLKNKNNNKMNVDYVTVNQGRKAKGKNHYICEKYKKYLKDEFLYEKR